MGLLDYIEKKINEKNELLESSQVDMTKEAFNNLAITFDKLSDAFAMMSKKANIDGGGATAGYLRNAEVAIINAKDKVKSASKHNTEEKFTPEQKKALGEIALSLEKISEKITSLSSGLVVTEIPIEPSFEQPEEEMPPKQESVRGRRKKVL